MTIISSGTADLKLQGLGDSNPSTGTSYFNQTLTIGNRSATCYVKVRENDPEPGVGPFYFPYDMVSGTQYGYAPGTSYTPAMVDTNPNLTINSSSTSGYTQDFGWTDWSSEAATTLTSSYETIYSSKAGWDFAGGNASMGSFPSLGFTDGGSNSRSVAMVAWQKNTASGPGAVTGTTGVTGNYIALALNQTNVPNTNSTFASIEIDGNTYNRSDAAEYNSSENNGTYWRWSLTDTQIDALPTSGTCNVKLNAANVTSSNTGIAEEFGGSDSTDVTLSHYYRGAPEGYVVSGASSNIPADGTNVELNFSDFYGTTLTSSSIHETSFTQGTSGSAYHANSGYNTAFGGSPSMSDTSITLSNSKSGTVSGMYGAYTNTTTTSGNITFQISFNSGTGATNAGFTTLKIWLNQSNSSGTPDQTLQRTSATYYTPVSDTAIWSWALTNIGYTTYFGGSATTLTHYIEIT